MPPQRLNHFQQTMLLWERLHPYVATHAVVIRGRLDMPRLRQAVESGCRRAGVGELHIDAARRTYRFVGGAAIDVAQRQDADQVDQALSEAIHDAMNQPFPEGPHMPLRWMAFDNANDDQHVIILAYHHVIGDARAAMRLLIQVVRIYTGCLDADETIVRAGLDPRRHRHVHGFGPVRMTLALARTVRQHLALRSAHRPPEDPGASDETQYTQERLDAGIAERLFAACGRRGCGLNDAFMAAVTCALAHRYKDKRKSHRRKIAIGTTVDYRKRARVDLSDYFGVCLTNGIALIADPDAGMERVLEQVTAQTRHMKRMRDRSDPASKFALIRHLWPLLRVAHRNSSYRKLFPICAGVSTVVVDAPLLAGARADVLRYLRAAPPGPSMPMVFAPTVYDATIELGLVYRPTCVNDDGAHALLRDVVERLADLSA